MKKLLILVCSALVCLSSPVFAKSLKIGMVIDDLRLERWQKDRDIFVDKAEELGAKVYVQSAGVLSNVISDAKRDGIKVLAYDRLISDADIDFYLSFDNERVGEMQAQAMLDAKPKGNYFLMGGAPTDNNAKLFRKGQMNILQPKIDSGDIKVVGDQWVNYWLAENALKIMENALTANNNKIDVVVASNDATAGGAIQALGWQDSSTKLFSQQRYERCTGLVVRSCSCYFEKH